MTTVWTLVRVSYGGIVLRITSHSQHGPAGWQGDNTC